MKRICFISLTLLLTCTIFAQSEKDDSKGKNNETASRFTDRKQKGFYSIMHVNLLLGAGSFVDGQPYYPPIVNNDIIAPVYYPGIRTALTISPSFTITNGYIINEHWAAGAGAGIEIFNCNLFPLFAELRHTLWDNKISPFWVLKTGYAFSGFRTRHYDELYLDWPPYNANNSDFRNHGGFLFNPEAGVKVPLNDNCDLLFTAAYRYQVIKSVVRREYYPGQFEEWHHIDKINRLSFGIAVMFR